MCINGHHNRLGDSEASAGMAWMSPKRRGRAQRRVSGKTQLVRGQLNFGLCPAPRPNCQRKNCCSGRPDHARGHPNSFCGGAHHVGCVKGLRLRTTSGSLRRDSSPPLLTLRGTQELLGGAITLRNHCRIQTLGNGASLQAQTPAEARATKKCSSAAHRCRR